MEDTMLKQLLVCTALVSLEVPANAQQREASLQKFEMQGASFDIVVATTKLGGWAFDPSTQADAYYGGVVHLEGGLVHPLTNELLGKFSKISAIAQPA
jgi:hypothetical protein